MPLTTGKPKWHDARAVRLAGWYVAIFVVAVIARYNEAGIPWFEMDSKTALVVLNAGVDAVLGALVVWLSPAAKSVGVK